MEAKGKNPFRTIRELRAKKVLPAVGGAGLLAYGLFSALYNRCPAEGALTETLSSLVSHQLECSGGEEALVKDVQGVVSSLDFCGKGDLPEPIIVDLPQGTWTGVAAACVSLLPKLEALIIEGKAPASWNCKKGELDRSALEVACSKLE